MSENVEVNGVGEYFIRSTVVDEWDKKIDKDCQSFLFSAEQRSSRRHEVRRRVRRERHVVQFGEAVLFTSRFDSFADAADSYALSPRVPPASSPFNHPEPQPRNDDRDRSAQ